jgi:glycosyltransferase involved in cell wall biosynthesis
MKVLVLAPQPFYMDRGTPIAVKCLVTEFSDLGWQVDLLTFHEGADIAIPNVRIIRIPRLPGMSAIDPGLSIKKLSCDVLLFLKAIRLAARGGYGYVHAVEESAFMAAALRWMFRLPYVYDMDSSMADQIVEKRPRMAFALPLLKRFEAAVVRRAAVVLPVCESLARIARDSGAEHTLVLTDPPAFTALPGPHVALTRQRLGIGGTCFMYVGNLESYQGIGMLLEAFAMAATGGHAMSLVIVGGKPADIATHQQMAETLGVAARTHFLGPKPLAEVGNLVAAADVLVSPRLTGVNTPMKIYAYLNSGKAILATDIESHSQVLTSDIAVLEPAVPERFAEGICRLAGNARMREELASRAAVVGRERYSQDAFSATVRRFRHLIESLTAA